jgi:hypothetical protein
MRIEAAIALAALCAGWAGLTLAQSRATNPGAAPAASQHALPSMGQGAGVHSAQSPIPPLPKRDDVLQWSVLTQVDFRVVKERFVPIYKANQPALNNTDQRIQGFMMPINPGEKHKHFLLTSVPLTCSFCVPGGPESMVEVRSKEGVAFTQEPVVMQGKFQVLHNDPYGLYYRLADAVVAK